MNYIVHKCSLRVNRFSKIKLTDPLHFSFVTHMEAGFVCFYIGEVSILLFRTHFMGKK